MSFGSLPPPDVDTAGRRAGGVASASQSSPSTMSAHARQCHRARPECSRRWSDQWGRSPERAGVTGAAAGVSTPLVPCRRLDLVQGFAANRPCFARKLRTRSRLEEVRVKPSRTVIFTWPRTRKTSRQIDEGAVQRR
jgi:hypothetical protein